MSKPSEHQQLAKQIADVDRKVDRKHKSVMTAITKARHEFAEKLDEKVGPIHDFMVGEQRLQAEQNKVPASPLQPPIPTTQNGAKVPPIVTDLVKIISWLVLGILAFLGIRGPQ